MRLFPTLLGCLVVLALFRPAPAVSQNCTYIDPRVKMSGYEEWCKCKGGDPYNNSSGVGCDVSRRSSTTQTYGRSYIPRTRKGLAMWAGMNLFGAFMQGVIRGMEQNQRRQAAYQRQLQLRHQRDRQLHLRRRNKEAKDESERRNKELAQIEAQRLEAKKKEDAQREQFAKTKKRVLRSLRSSTFDGDVQPRSTLGSLKLSYRATKDPTQMTAAQRTTCAQMMLSSAGTAAGSITIAHDSKAAVASLLEAAFLSKNAKWLLGGTQQIDIQCGVASGPGPGAPVTTPGAAQAAEHARKAYQELKDNAEFYTYVFERTAAQIASYEKARVSFESAEDDVKEAKQKKAQAKKHLEKVKTEVTKRKEAKKKKEPKKKKKKTIIVQFEDDEEYPLLTKARATEAQAEKHLKTVEAILSKQRKKLGDVEKRIYENADLVQKFNQDPKGRAEILQTIRAESGAKPS